MFGWFLVETGQAFSAILDLPRSTEFILVHLHKYQLNRQALAPPWGKELEHCQFLDISMVFETC